MTEDKKTKANVPPPARAQKHSYLGSIASDQPINLVGNNMKARASDQFSDLNFKVKPDFRTEFKISAAAAGLSMKQLLMVGYKLWVLESGKGNSDLPAIIRQVKDLDD